MQIAHENCEWNEVEENICKLPSQCLCVMLSLAMTPLFKFARVKIKAQQLFYKLPWKNVSFSQVGSSNVTGNKVIRSTVTSLWEIFKCFKGFKASTGQDCMMSCLIINFNVFKNPRNRFYLYELLSIRYLTYRI